MTVSPFAVVLALLIGIALGSTLIPAGLRYALVQGARHAEHKTKALRADRVELTALAEKIAAEGRELVTKMTAFEAERAKLLDVARLLLKDQEQLEHRANLWQAVARNIACGIPDGAETFVRVAAAHGIHPEMGMVRGRIEHA